MLAQIPTQEDPMNSIDYIGFDIHKKPNYRQMVTPR
jgi:hypothetical protein